ncbi:hypothetical protein [Taibaiella sp. KBW10]|uniref:hypothetical protein n=1 Tax=Taibaiella sp. KBW10 TaxID=2153357 RepID=UPI000F5B6880|nr:hypothetical protein [Taibaiella sp. KBW10]
MMRKYYIYPALCLAMGFTALVSCKSTPEQAASTPAHATETVTPDKAIKIEPLPASPEFADAALSIKDVTTVPVGKDSVKVTINYTVDHYELKKQTDAPTAKECNNSAQGQHIHFILDNKPYAALYEPTHSFTVPVNSKHDVMSFLSRSYHESLKNKGAGVLLRFAIDEKGAYKKLENPKTPMIFYSRPKGDYVGNDTKNVLLDFYVYNTTLSETGDKVKVTINGNAFTISHWVPQFIQNAPMGSMKVKLELIDKDGKNISGDHTAVERDVQLAQQEPMK